MPNRLIRNTAILLKTEATYGVDPVPTGAANALLVSNLSITPFNAQNVDRDNIRPFLGGSEQLVGTRYVQCGFDLEISGSGTVATAPAWGPALMACGFAETLTALTRADYTPVSTGFTSATIYWHDDGLLHKATGCRGNVVFKLGVGQRPVMSFAFTGLYSTPTAVANPTAVLTAFRTPQVVTDANTGDIILGGTHAAATAPLIVAGTTFISQGIEIDMGNKVDFNALLGGETVDLTQRAVTGKVMFDLDAAPEAAAYAAVESNTLASLGMVHGTVANQRVLMFCPSVQRINPSKGEANGKRMVGFDLRMVPVIGNDEIRVVTSF
jgi:hypothetical protein